jgi:hypothetical protein
MKYLNLNFIANHLFSLQAEADHKADPEEEKVLTFTKGFLTKMKI